MRSCHFLKSDMMLMVPVTRYLGFKKGMRHTYSGMPIIPNLRSLRYFLDKFSADRFSENNMTFWQHNRNKYVLKTVLTHHILAVDYE